MSTARGEPQQYDALVALASGMTPEEAWQEVSKHLATEIPASAVDPDNLTAAAERTPDRYALVSGPEELEDMLAHPFAAWRVFLHGRQRDIAYRPSYSGPVMVSGAAGTGKTVTALHRAALLSRTGRVLLTTFTRTLAEALDQQLALLDHTGENIDVLNVDRLAHQIVREVADTPPKIVDPRSFQRMWQEAARDTEFSAVFLQREWEQVILAQNITSEEQYLRCDRHGRGRGLGTGQRARAWAAIGNVLQRLEDTHQSTHLQVAEQAAKALTTQSARYRHVVVDEAQDLHPAQWRLLRAAVAPGPDDLFLVGDPNQRIYDNRVSLNSLGISIRGRSHRLMISYRTTQEILSWSVRVLSGATTGLDGEPDDLTGYRSLMHGRRPEVRSYPDRQAELAALAHQVRVWVDSGVEQSSIGVAARTGQVAAQAKEALRDHPGVHVGTMHGMKGLEFRCVALVAIDHDSLPLAAAVTPLDEDPIAHEHDEQRERCLLFVAGTRARDALVLSYTGQGSPFVL